jgi:cytochrome c oxidase subunit 2
MARGFPPRRGVGCSAFRVEKMRVMKRILGSLGALAVMLAAGAAPADQPRPWEMRFQPAATDMMRQITWFEQYTLWFIVPITLLVLFLLAYCVFRFRASANPTPSRTSHNTIIEVLWTVGPVVILLFLAIPSFQLLTAQYNPPEEPKLTLKATGNQWNWDYEYQIAEPLSFNSALLKDGERAGAGKTDLAKYPRLLTVDNELVVPVNTTTRVLVTAADVIHAFAMPAFGIKTDAVPGRTNEVWFKAEKEGLYYGQCSELCGQDHAFMPIAIRVVSEARYNSWLAAAKTDLGGANKALMAEIDAQRKVASAAD